MADQHQQMLLATKERVDEAVNAVYQQHGYLVDGEPNKQLVEDKLFDRVSGAIVEKRADRGKIAVTKRQLVATVFPNVPGPDAWAEQDDPGLAEEVYDRLEGYVWRVCSDDANGKLQSRLNGDLRLILCRTKATPDKTWGVYVTRDLKTLLEDYTKPQRKRIEQATVRLSANLAMATERLPQFHRAFKKELDTGMSTALGAGTNILTPAIEAAKADLQGDEDE